MNAKWIVLLLLPILTSTTLMDVKAQLSGKTYEGRVRYVCKKMVDGGCAITTFCVLQFKEQTVDVYYYAKASCTPKEREADYSYDESDEKKTYEWKASGNVITIKGFEEYGTLRWQEHQLTGSKGSEEEEEVAFVEKQE